MSSANQRLHMGLPPMEMNVWWSWSVSYKIFSRNKWNRMGESKHSWWAPAVVLKNSPNWLFKRTALLEISYSGCMAWTRLSRMLKLPRTCYRLACHTLSDAFLNSMKLWNTSCWCCRCFSMVTCLLKLCSTVLWPGPKPSGSSSSALALTTELV